MVKLIKTLIRKKLVKKENIELLTNELKANSIYSNENYIQLKKVVKTVLNDYVKKDIHKIIISTARDTMYLTALSQNSFVDILVVVVNNFNMIKKS